MFALLLVTQNIDMRRCVFIARDWRSPETPLQPARRPVLAQSDNCPNRPQTWQMKVHKQTGTELTVHDSRGGSNCPGCGWQSQEETLVEGDAKSTPRLERVNRSNQETVRDLTGIGALSSWGPSIWHPVKSRNHAWRPRNASRDSEYQFPL